MVPKNTLTIAWYFLQKAREVFTFAAEMVVQPPLAFNGVFLGVLVAAAMKIYFKWSLDVHRRATNASHWQLVSRKAFYFAVTFSAAALRGSPQLSHYSWIGRQQCYLILTNIADCCLGYNAYLCMVTAVVHLQHVMEERDKQRSTMCFFSNSPPLMEIVVKVDGMSVSRINLT